MENSIKKQLQSLAKKKEREDYIDQITNAQSLEFSKWIDFINDLENTHLKGGEIKLSKSNLIAMTGKKWNIIEPILIDKLTKMGFEITIDKNDPVLYDDILTFKKQKQ